MKILSPFRIVFIITLFLAVTPYSFSQLSGSYTVGNGGNYLTLDAAVTDAETQGVSGPVTFNLLTGTYDELVIMDSVPGSSSINTLTIKSETGNLADVIFVSRIFINGGDNIVFENMTFRRVHFSVRLEIAGYSNNIKVNSCLFTADAEGSEDVRQILASGIVENLEIMNSTFNVETTMLELSSSGLKLVNNSILGGSNLWNNTLAGFALRIRNSSNVIVKGNYIQAPGTKLLPTSFSLSNSTNFDVSKNKIYGYYGPGIGNCGDDNVASLFSNNFVRASFSSFLNVRNMNCLYNSFFGSWNVGNLTRVSFINNIMQSNSIFSLIDYMAPVNDYASDYNNYNNEPDTGFIRHNGINYSSISDFYNATGLDQHSKTQQVTFVSGTDLHLAGSSIGDQQLIGTPTPLVTDDIDGHPRNLLYPYKGADEADIPLPVELASFTSSVTNNTVNLKWTTSVEINNSGFEIERRDARGETQDVWNRVGFIHGHVTTSEVHNYEFIDRNLSSGVYNYRLKQIDFNGNSEYHNLLNEVVIGTPIEFKLSQNYPNPFNPTTIISYDIPSNVRRQMSNVKLIIFNTLGKEVVTLVNESKDAGYHKVEFSAGNFSSGIYFYSLNVDGKNIDTKRMLLLK